MLLVPSSAVLYRVEAVDVEGLAVLPALEHPLARIVVQEVGGLAVVGDLPAPVLLVPDDGPLLAAGLAAPAGHVATLYFFLRSHG